LFPNALGRPNGHFLRVLKKLAKRAGLNCGECVTKKGLSCQEHPVCDKWELHKFRRTFATIHHESGVSARTLQAWIGHSSLETTLAYLQIADLRSERTRTQVNHSFATFAETRA
jgi:integrase